jgi:hypothetical protein
LANGEHRMVFDLRGKRKRAVQVVYALLAFIMAASLFLTVGPVSFTDLFNGGSSSSSGSSVLTDQAEAIEKKLAKDPKNEQLLARDVRARYAAGNSSLQTDPSTGQTAVTQDAIDQYNRAGDAWERYLAVAGAKANPDVASLASKALTSTITTQTPVAVIDSNLKAAVRAQQIAANAKPSLGAYATLAQLAYFAGDTASGDQASAKAKAQAPKTQITPLQQSLKQYKKGGAAFHKQVQTALKSNKGGGKQALQNPLGGLSGGGGGLGAGSP